MEESIINVLSLFNGISGCHLALDRAGIKTENVYYSEIDKFANLVTQYHYPNDTSLGDVTKWQEWAIDWSTIDLVTAGFPCQAWSVAGKQLGDKDERGMLFWTTLDIIKEVLKHNPKSKFLMENVKMKKDFEEYITHHTVEALGYVEKILINSSLVSAQNRNRYYWTNFKVTQPEDKGIFLKDILEFDVESNPASIVGRRINSRGVRDDYNKDVPIIQCLQVKNCNKKMGCLTTVQKDTVLSTEPSGRYLDIYNRDDVCYRNLTTIECERLQTFPDNFTNILSDSQRHKSLGNGWTIDVITHIFKCMLEHKDDQNNV